MRILKFRAWDRVTKAMLFPAWITRRGIEFGENGWSSNIFILDYELMQYTGLLDRQGKEIYEGDIVATSHTANQSITWEDGCYLLKPDNYFLGKVALYWEVIGNIYEHKNLLDNTDIKA